ncbi:MAG: choloylglycine hydrolase family protein [Pseudomonadota bacterium]
MTTVRFFCAPILTAALTFSSTTASACTFISLTGSDGTVVAARTMEWGSFDLLPVMTFLPAGTELSGMDMPDGKPGASWTARYDVTGVTLLDQMLFGDGMNSEGLSISLLYLPGFAEFQDYLPDQAANSIAPPDFVGYMLSQFATVAEVQEALQSVRVVPIVTPELGMAAPVHYAITDKSGDEIIVEYVDGELNIHEETLGVMTNSPPYDWHVTNVRNYLNLRAVDWPTIEVEGIDMAPIGVGTGMIGLPGDYTPPSRFIRALAWTQTSRPTTGGSDTVSEVMRILDSFQLPLPSADENPNPSELAPLEYSATQYTVAYDLKNLTVYFHTSDNPAIRSVSMTAFDFDAAPQPVNIPMRNPGMAYAIDVTPNP